MIRKTTRINSNICNYNYDINNNELRYWTKNNTINTSKLILNQITLPTNYIELITKTSNDL